MITMESRIGEVYATTVGHDAFYKMLLQLNIPEKVVLNPIVSRLKLSTIAKLANRWIKQDAFEAIVQLINTEKDVPVKGEGPITEKWWKEAVFYQIYPRSFYDTNGDGIGDLRGIIDKLDYLQNLGVTALWLSPIYDSPNDDNGYDIRDYHKIMEEFGTMEDFDELLEKIHEKGMRLIMDLVVNHTSDEHEWFKKALEDPTSKYHDYYFFREKPNNWTSFFAGSAWNYYEDLGEYALHLFSKKQMDLNWDNPELRDEVIKMVNWWLDKGVDGFRMDVINYISKTEGLPEGNKTIGDMMGYPGIEYYYYGPNLHKYLHEVHEKAFAPHDAFSVGETPGVGMKMCQLITGEERKELDMVFSFDHLETPGHVRFDDYVYDLNYYRDYMIDWMTNYGNNCWMSVFYNNHDNPRMVSKIDPTGKYRQQVAKLLAAMQLTMKGTPFIFQGDEMGLENYKFTSIDQITDVEAKGYYKEFCEKKSPEDAFKQILTGTREHCRVLLPWNDKVIPEHEGLVQGIDYKVTSAYMKLIQLRKEEKGLVYGNFEVLNNKKDRFVYKRSYGNAEYIIDCNLSSSYQESHAAGAGFYLLYGTEEEAEKIMKPYEARIWKRG